MRITKKYIDDLTYKIIGAAIEVYKILGPALMEKDYEGSLLVELGIRGLEAKTQKRVERNYKGHELKGELRFDILVEDLVVIEVKAVQKMHPIFDAVIMSYMKYLKAPKGILINFHVNNIFYEGQKTFVNEYYAALPDE